MEHIKKLEDILSGAIKTVIEELDIETILGKSGEYRLNVNCMFNRTEMKTNLTEIRKPKLEKERYDMGFNFENEVIELQRDLPLHLVNKSIADNLDKIHLKELAEEFDSYCQQLQDDRKHGLTE